MTQKQPTVLDILKHLDRSNCKECGLPTCTAFAAAVLQGRRTLRGCPRLGEEAIGVLGEPAGETETGVRAEEEREALLARRKAEMARVDFEAAASRLDAEVKGDRLALRVLGKTFELDRQGELYSECHINPWVHLPILDYVTQSAGRELTDDWVPFRDLRQAKDWQRFFEFRCERGLKELVDQDEEFFLDVMSLFSPSTSRKQSIPAIQDADDILLLYPLPRVPLLLAYWRADEEFESRLTLLFDRSAEVNLGAGSIYQLIQGIVEMVRRMFDTHGVDRSALLADSPG